MSRSLGENHAVVFPTRVGVDLGTTIGLVPRLSFSPHAWGWTYKYLDALCSRIVFPTRVGVDRALGVERLHSDSFPHTRGGEPS